MEADKQPTGSVNEFLNKYAEAILVVSLVMLAIAAMAATAFLFVFKFHTPPYGMSQLGQVGDYFGGLLNPLIGVITILAVYFTFRMQKEELKTAKSDLDATRQIMSEQRDAIQLQRFEQTFFAWTAQYSSLLNLVEAHKQKGTQAVTMALDSWARPDCLNGFDSYADNDPKSSTRSPFQTKELRAEAHEKIKNVWIMISLHHPNVFNPIMRSLVEIVTWILDQPNLKDSEKLLYLGILDVQISRDEKFLLAYYMAFMQGTWSSFAKMRAYGFFRTLEYTGINSISFIFHFLEQVIEDHKVEAQSNVSR